MLLQNEFTVGGSRQCNQVITRGVLRGTTEVGRRAETVEALQSWRARGHVQAYVRMWRRVWAAAAPPGPSKKRDQLAAAAARSTLLQTFKRVQTADATTGYRMLEQEQGRLEREQTPQLS